MITHLACIMDGNRRWASQRGLPSMMGHREGVKAVERVIKYCLERGVRYLSLYTFSLENFKRSVEERTFLFNLIAEQAQAQMTKALKNGIRIKFVGDRALFPDHVKKVCEDIEAQTKDQSKITVNILFCYGGRQEIVAACKEVCDDIDVGLIKKEELSPEYFQGRLWTGDCPSPDLIVRTGGVKRLSNFLLFQAAYSELFFTDTFWPALSDFELEEIWKDYHHIKRNFGI
jgi:undecaprenyl diphosphate synthase